MRIHMINLETGKPIFGALRLNLVEYIGFIVEGGKLKLIFKTDKGDHLECERSMLQRIQERLVENKFCTKVIDEALNDERYKTIN